MIRPQPYRLKWPHTSHQQEGIDEMFDILFKAVRLAQSDLLSLTTTVNNIGTGVGVISTGGTVLISSPGRDVEDGAMGPPGLPGATGPQGLIGPSGQDGEDNDTRWPSAGDNFQNTLTGLYVPYMGAITNVDLGLHNLTVDSPTFFVDSVNHRVGVGLINPSQTFEVLGNATIDGQWTAVAAFGNIGVLNNSTADAGVTGGIYLTFQTATTTRWFLGMSTSGANGNFELYNNIGALGLVFSANKTTGIITLAKGLVVTTGGITGTLNTAAQTNITSVGTLSSLVISGALTSGAITTVSPLIVHTNGAAQRIDIGATGDTSSSSQIRFFQDSTHFNWQVGAGVQNNDTLSFTPSTVVNGTTFSSPLFSINSGGTTSFAAHSVTQAANLLLNLDNSAADAGVTNAVYQVYKTAGTIRYYVGISTSAANGDYEIYNNGAGNLAFSVNKTSSGIKLFGKLLSYNNVVATGWGVPAIYGTGRSTAQTAAVASVATYTVGAADGSFDVSANVNVTTSTLHNFTTTCAYTDETNTARVLTMSFSQLTGAFVTAITNATGAGPYEGVSLRIRCKASTAITIATVGVGGFTTVTYNVEGSIIQVS